MVPKALKYAEVDLGVHKVYEDAQKARTDLTTAMAKLVKAKDDKRRLEYAMSDREQELLQLAWMETPDMSQARMDKHHKTLVHADPLWIEYRHELGRASSEIDTCDAARQLLEQDIKIATSRLIELGGYLNYLAAVKQAASPTTPE